MKRWRKTRRERCMDGRCRRVGSSRGRIKVGELEREGVEKKGHGDKKSEDQGR
jgi:hypothetical protein